MGTHHPYRILGAFLSASAAFGCAGALRADLAPSSPFLPANSAAAGAQGGGPAGPVELRGIMATSQGVACRPNGSRVAVRAGFPREASRPRGVSTRDGTTRFARMLRAIPSCATWRQIPSSAALDES